MKMKAVCYCYTTTMADGISMATLVSIPSDKDLQGPKKVNR